AKADRTMILGAQSARRFGLGIGDSLVVRLSTVTGQQNVVDYKVGAVYDDTAAGGMTTVLVPLADLLSDLNMKEGEYQSLVIFLPDASKADATAKQLGASLEKAGYLVSGSVTGKSGQDGASATATTGLKPGASLYRISTVTELSGQMGTVLGSVRWIGATIFVIMLLLTSAGIANTYRMVLMERTKEIGMLRCIGFRQKDVFKIFIYEAAMIALGGSLAGILASLPAGLLIHLIPFNPQGSLGSALSRGRLIFSPSPLTYLLVCLIVVVASMLAVSSSARKAARLQPVEAIGKTV
ncbi:MAG: FtsX-like permease family protein, partial [Spirochaetaceae bacterium]|nr:FtsX-like permease family protein [Spirochaetaceae bacterium]